MKGSKGKEKNKAKKDKKKKDQSSELLDKAAAKPKVDELLVSVFSYRHSYCQV